MSRISILGSLSWDRNSFISLMLALRASKAFNLSTLSRVR